MLLAAKLGPRSDKAALTGLLEAERSAPNSIRTRLLGLAIVAAPAAAATGRSDAAQEAPIDSAATLSALRFLLGLVEDLDTTAVETVELPTRLQKSA